MVYYVCACVCAIQDAIVVRVLIYIYIYICIHMYVCMYISLVIDISMHIEYIMKGDRICFMTALQNTHAYVHVRMPSHLLTTRHVGGDMYHIYDSSTMCCPFLRLIYMH